MSDQRTSAESPSVMNIRASADDRAARVVVFETDWNAFHVSIDVLGDSLYVVVQWPSGVRALLRTAHAPGSALHVRQLDIDDERVSVTAESGCGKFDVIVRLLDGDEPMVRAQTVLTPGANMSINTWPRDLIVLGPRGRKKPAKGTVNVMQSGLSASMLQLSVGDRGSLFYFQNLTSLAGYAQSAGVSLSGTVGGEWPELGFALPGTKPGRFLPAHEQVIISDAFLRVSAQVPRNHLEVARHLLHHLGETYLNLDHRKTTYRDWSAAAEHVIDDLDNCVGCWTFAAGKKYVNAYLSDYATTPELMVQLAVLMPLLDYGRCTGEQPVTAGAVRSTLESFYDEEIQTMRRWLPSRDDGLDGSEEQKKPNVMDSWYLYHTLLNLGRLAARKDAGARTLFFDSVEYAIRVARKYKYDWPIFFDVKTLEVIKAESKPGAGGQKDVPGIYAHVMLQAWDMTGDQRYLDEAMKAGRALANRGFEIYYQANITAFGAYAMFRLWKLTGKKRFLDASYLCLANIFGNMWLWDCDYGFGQNYTTFLSVIPVKDAPYVASYEEQEVCATFATLLTESAEDDVLPAATLLLSEYVRHLAERAWFSYPRNVPADTVADRPKTGELARELWIPLEDMQDGWQKSGAVGQEVYGAGLALGVVVRHYHPIHDGQWTVYAETLIRGPQMTSKTSFSLSVLGDERIASRLRVFGEGRPRRLTVKASLGGAYEELQPRTTREGHLEYVVRGRQEITCEW